MFSSQFVEQTSYGVNYLSRSQILAFWARLLAVDPAAFGLTKFKVELNIHSE
jgi:hypothetical protein